MNALDLLIEAEVDPLKIAFFSLAESSLNRSLSFAQLTSIASSMQKSLKKLGIQRGDSILLAEQISPELYGAVLGILGLGATVILVEPFLPVAEIDAVILQTKPKLFLASFFGQAWGMRVKSIRAIPNWAKVKNLIQGSSNSKFLVESMNASDPGIITFTSGTTGKPKGVVRTHEGLVLQNRVIVKHAHFQAFQNSPDLAIFANLVLANLAMGRGSVFVPPKWKAPHLNRLNDLPASMRPETMTGGPAFLRHVMKLPSLDLSSLKSIHIGGALTDCDLFKRAFERWKEARFIHVYGSSEAEPVALSDARLAVKQSEDAGFFQTLSLGRTISEIESVIDTEGDKIGLWVTGPHVGKFYIANEAENLLSKRRGSDGRVWHFMGDRVKENQQGLWYQGRSGQEPSDFELEQKIYSHLRSSASFIHRDQNGSRVLVGEKLKNRKTELLAQFPELNEIREKKIIRDRRHRARIDRVRSMA